MFGRLSKIALTLSCMLLALAMGGARDASASVVSRLGAIYFYDPMTFDAGVLQRGASSIGRVGTQGASLDAGTDLTFYQDAALRLAYVQRFHLDAADGFDLSWRLRMPIVEMARYGFLSSVQVNYEGSHAFGPAAPLSPNHALVMAYSASRLGSLLATTRHIQGGMAYRDGSKVSDDLTLGRLGVVFRLAQILQLYRPPRGIGGKWTVTISALELNLVHYGASLARGGDGRLELSIGAPAVHFSHRRATYTLGLVPLLIQTYGAEGSRLDWSGLVNLSIFYRRQPE